MVQEPEFTELSKRESETSLEKAFEAYTMRPFLTRLLPVFDELASDPRFDEACVRTLTFTKTMLSNQNPISETLKEPIV